jgi:hypothetical protein
VALHARLYADRPAASRLTQFYLVMSAGGVLGGLFAALVAPVLFDWTWEHPILILAAAVFVPLDYWKPLLGRLVTDARAQRLSLTVALALVFVGGSWIQKIGIQTGWLGLVALVSFAVIVALSMILAAKRWSFVLAMAAVLLALGGVRQISTSITGDRARSYFGIYAAGLNDEGDMILLHGTTLHGIQISEEGQQLEPTSYYVRQSGIGIAMTKAPEMFGPHARIGVVGLGVGTLACYRQPGQDWTFFEIDPLVYDFSQRGVFTFMDECAGDAPVLFGDARLVLEELPANSFDLLAIDAFSSDAIPQHLLTREALEIYFDVLADDGVVMVHISNRFVDLRPVLAQLAQDGGYAAARRSNVPEEDELAATPSIWVALSRDPARIEALTEGSEWHDLGEPKGGTWTDEYASILPHLIWANFL